MWTRLARFVAQDGNIYYGDLIDPVESMKFPYTGCKAKVIDRDPFSSSYTVSDNIQTVKEMLAPIEKSKIPIFKMIGLNYVKHIKESGLPFPESPCLFLSPSTATNGPSSDVLVPQVAQDGTLDYEGELVLIIGKTGRNIPVEEAESYILGYAVGNDVSARKWQKSNGTQWCFGKGFDGFAPFGPWITRRDAVNYNDFNLSVTINDEAKPRQSSPCNDMLFKPKDIISFLSKGTTLEAGTVIFAGTPAGAAFSYSPPKWLQDNDQVTVNITSLGSISNKMKYEA